MNGYENNNNIAFVNMKNGMEVNSVLTIPTDVWRSDLSLHAKILYILMSEYEIDTRHWLGSRYECGRVVSDRLSNDKMKILVSDFNYHIGEMISDYIFSLENNSAENLLKTSAQELIEKELIKVAQ
jgi:hypothetical protein